MSILETLDSLGLPVVTDEAETLSAVAKKQDSNVVRVEGVILARTDDAVVLRAQGRVFRVPVSALLSLEKDESQPSLDILGNGVAVRLALEPTAELLEIQKISASAFAPVPAVRPLVFAVPSDASRYAAVMPEDFTPMTGPTQSPYSTPRSTPYQSPFPTGDRQDYTTDYSSDPIMDTKIDDGDA